ncbi:DUF6527 family protein [Burkholderia stagnalis]|uniref:DUF6527 family protein n=1 Tax=Burkholderia stagnalis TaxID=1503054 RepID=UPI0012D893BF|nr:DUF6527 family protein [Burkholderia stagnalis]
MKIKTIIPEFVENLPEELREGVLYISEEFSIAAHKCCCGCGEDVITPLNSAQWHLTKSGGAVSLSPSIGNWKYECRSHYWIKNNRVVEASAMSESAIEHVKRRDRRDKDHYVRRINDSLPAAPREVGKQPRLNKNHFGLDWLTSAIRSLKGWFCKAK